METELQELDQTIKAMLKSKSRVDMLMLYQAIMMEIDNIWRDIDEKGGE